ncbi:MAG: hypothetical protein VX085_00550 [Pseudomonadota bacterium]|nr:hypothetical protein [Pseudomonadota bacterium]
MVSAELFLDQFHYRQLFELIARDRVFADAVREHIDGCFQFGARAHFDLLSLTDFFGSALAFTVFEYRDRKCSPKTRCRDWNKSYPKFVPNFKIQIAILPTTLRLAVGRDYAAIDRREYQ